MFALDGSENYAGIYERYKSSGDNYDTNGGWSEWTKVSAPLANDLTQDVPGLALDAAQGKVLNDKITQLNSDLEWKDAGGFRQSETFTLPSDWKEVEIFVSIYSKGKDVYEVGNYLFDFYICNNIPAGAINFYRSYNLTTEANGGCRVVVNFTTGEVSIGGVYEKGIALSDCPWHLRYR